MSTVITPSKPRNLKQAAAMYAALCAERKALDAEIDALRSLLIAQADESGLVHFRSMIVARVTTSFRDIIKSDLVRKLHPEIVAEVTTTSEVTKVDVLL